MTSIIDLAFQNRLLIAFFTDKVATALRTMMRTQCTSKSLYTNQYHKDVRLIKIYNELNHEILNTFYCII